MKKLILAAFAVISAVSVFAQGTITFNMRAPTTIHIWGPSATAPALSLIGLGSNDNPSGTTPYSTDLMAMIGAAGTGGQYAAATTLAQLIGLNGSGQPDASLVPLGQTTTFRTGGASGNVFAIADTLTGNPGVSKDQTAATLEIVAWDDSSGLYATWDTASVAWAKGWIAAGKDTPFTILSIGGDVNTPPNVTPGAVSFNLYFVPEPSTFALAGLGAAAMLIFRRRK